MRVQTHLQDTLNMAVHPEIYHLQPTSFVPNNRLPVLIYRNVLPQPHNEQSAQEMLEKNHWTKKANSLFGFLLRLTKLQGNVGSTVFQGHPTLLIGRGPHDNDEERSVSTELEPGDVIILPAGVAHCSIDGDSDYRSIGLYPE
ncbi:hypothetical protein LARI1_G007602, partial [Lachnellula arida]